MPYVHKRTSTRTGTPLSGGTRLSHALIMFISLSFRRFTHTVQSSSCSSVTGSGGNVLAKPCSVCNVLHVQAYNDTKESFFFLLVLRFVALVDERKPHAASCRTTLSLNAFYHPRSHSLGYEYGKHQRQSD